MPSGFVVRENRGLQLHYAEEVGRRESGPASSMTFVKEDREIRLRNDKSLLRKRVLAFETKPLKPRKVKRLLFFLKSYVYDLKMVLVASPASKN